jgi:hypothetical protein
MAGAVSAVLLADISAWGRKFCASTITWLKDIGMADKDPRLPDSN